jgi:molybdate transport repressor ModE-like protein
MPTIATSSTPPPLSICWSWDLGLGLSTAESTALLGLLAALREHGTLGQAATAASTSYRAAWGLLRKCEQALGKALVIKAPGKGTQLSAFAEQLLQLDGVARSTLQEIHAPWGQRLQELLSPSEAVEPERLRIAASHDLALADWIENGRHITVDIFWRGSEEALLALARGECDAAGFHLPTTLSGEQAATWLGRWLKPRQFVFFPIMRRQHGILTAAGNPFGIQSLADVARLGLRMVNRQRGSGTRGMIDQLMAANGLNTRDIPGYAHEEFTHDAVASAIASGQADVGFGIQAAAARYDLGFVPLGQDQYCLAVRSSIAHSSAVRQLIRRFLGNTFHERLAALPGYVATSVAGELLPWEQFTAALNDQPR